jgi:aspartate aminotransferase
MPPVATMDAATLRRAGRLEGIGVSEILRLLGLAAEYRRQGRPVLDLCAGEPDFETPPHVAAAAVEAIHKGATKYTALDGSADLKAAIREKFRRENSLEVELAEITAGAGAKQVIFNAFMATLDPGDEVILPEPYWTSYADMVRICGGRVVTVHTDERSGFCMSAEDLEKAITPRTRWVLLNSPGNPTGAVYPAARIAELAKVLARHRQVWLMSDEIYEHIVYDKRKHLCIAAVQPELRDRCLTVNGVSKAYAMTGWRLGYAAGPAALIKAIAAVQSQSTSCPSSISQAAAVAALNGPQALVAQRRAIFEERRNLVADAIGVTPGLACARPAGAFYLFFSCAGLIGRKTPGGKVIADGAAYCEYLLEHANVAVVPGSAFAAPNHVRLSYAVGADVLREACARIRRANADLQ